MFIIQLLFIKLFNNVDLNILIHVHFQPIFSKNV